MWTWNHETIPIIFKKIPIKLRNQTITVASKIKIIRSQFNKRNKRLVKLYTNILKMKGINKWKKKSTVMYQKTILLGWQYFQNWFMDSIIIPVKTPEAFFNEIDELIMNSIWKCKKARLAKTVLQKSNKVEEPTCFDFKISCKSTIIKTARHWPKKRHIV